jgi:radical SAM superfamily enzyme YgiQ (UPF0313 family)
VKVTLIQPYYPNIWEPIGLAYIAGYVRRHTRVAIEWNFFQGYFDTDDTIVEGCRDSDIIGFSVTSPTFRHGVNLAKRIKEVNPNAHCVFGGWHVSALGELAFEPGVDQIVIGEGESAFLEIVSGNRERIVRGQKLPFTELPWPDRKLIRNDRTAQLCHDMIGERIASFQGNRVCPVNCTYCAERVVTGRFNRTSNPIRSRDPVDLCNEIEQVVADLHLDKFKFVDATFDISPQYVIAFCQEKIRRGITTPWECLVHVSFASEEIFPWLKRSQCHQINVGVETGSPKVMRAIHKGVKHDTVRNVFRWARDYGIERRAFFILGVPCETEEDLILTEEFAREIDPDVFGATILCPYPGSEYYDHLTMKNIPWENTDEYSNDFWCNEHMTNAQLKAWQKRLSDGFRERLCARQPLREDV